MISLRQRARDDRGQALLEFAVCLPLVLVLALGVIEVSYGLLDQHVVTKLSREGANLISRDTALQDALTAMKTMTTRNRSKNGSRGSYGAVSPRRCPFSQPQRSR